MAMNLQQIRDFVRTSLDLELEDLPDTLLDAFIRDGSKRIERAEPRWSFYEKIFSLATTVGVSSYGKTSAIASDLDQIQAISVDDRMLPLMWIGMDELNRLQVMQPSLQGRPIYFSEWGDQVIFFPTPDQAYTLTIRGYRKPEDWVANGAGAEPDFPDELHNTVATFALSKAYAQQEDPELSALYERQFSDELNEFQRRLTQTPMSQPLVLNGGPRTRSGMSGQWARPWYSYAGGIF